MTTVGFLLSLIGFIMTLVGVVKVVEFIRYETGTHRDSWGMDAAWFEVARREGWLRDGRMFNLGFMAVGILLLLGGLYLWDFTMPSRSGQFSITVISMLALFFGTVIWLSESQYTAVGPTVLFVGLVGLASAALMSNA